MKCTTAPDCPNPCCNDGKQLYPYLARVNIEYSLEVYASDEQSAVEKAQDVDLDDWVQARSPIEVEEG
jgi:hypothetical protein